MATLTPTTIHSWIKRLGSIVESCNGVVDADMDVPNPIWHATRNARTQAIILRDELLEIAVVAVKVEDLRSIDDAPAVPAVRRVVEGGE